MHTLLSLLFNFQDTIEKTLFQFPLMGTSGLEPPTSRLSGVRSNHLSYAPIQNCKAILNIEFCFEVKDLNFASETAKHRLSILLLCNSCWCFSSYPSYPFGGDEEDRTPDPLLAKQVLSQLSYTPNKVGIQVSLCLCQDTNRPNKFGRSQLCFA